MYSSLFALRLCCLGVISLPWSLSALKGREIVVASRRQCWHVYVCTRCLSWDFCNVQLMHAASCMVWNWCSLYCVCVAGCLFVFSFVSIRLTLCRTLCCVICWTSMRNSWGVPFCLLSWQECSLTSRKRSARIFASTSAASVGITSPHKGYLKCMRVELSLTYQSSSPAGWPLLPCQDARAQVPIRPVRAGHLFTFDLTIMCIIFLELDQKIHCFVCWVTDSCWSCKIHLLNFNIFSSGSQYAQKKSWP